MNQHSDEVYLQQYDGDIFRLQVDHILNNSLADVLRDLLADLEVDFDHSQNCDFQRVEEGRLLLQLFAKLLQIQINFELHVVEDVPEQIVDSLLLKNAAERC